MRCVTRILCITRMFRVTGVLLMVIAVALLGIAALPAADAPKGEPIRIGAVFSVTGPASWLGEPESNVAKTIEAEVNAQGGISGRPVEVIVKDVQADETVCVNAVKDLLRSNVVAIIGPSTSGPSMAVAPICDEAQVPLVSCAAVLGGLGNNVAAVAAGLLLGVLEAISVGYLKSDYKDAIALGVLLIVLFIRPRGLFGRSAMARLVEY